MPVYADPSGGLAVPAGLLQAWTARLVESLGTPNDIAADVAEVLVASDRRGIASHGTARLPNYIALIEAGVMDPARSARGRRRPAGVDALRCAQRLGASRWPRCARRRHRRGTGPGSRRDDGPQLESLRDRRLVCASGGGGRADRDLALEHLAARRAHSGTATPDRHQPHRPGRPGRPVRIVLPRHGDFDDPARSDRSRGPSRGAAARRLGHRRRGSRRRRRPRPRWAAPSIRSVGRRRPVATRAMDCPWRSTS